MTGKNIFTAMCGLFKQNPGLFYQIIYCNLKDKCINLYSINKRG